MFWGPRSEKQKGEDILQVFGSDSTHFYILTAEGRKGAMLSITKVETDSLKVVNSRRLFFAELDGLKPLYLQPLVFAGKSYLVTTADDVKNDLVYIHAVEIDEGLSFLAEPKLLGTISRKAILNSGIFRLQASTSDQYLMALLPLEADPGLNEKFAIRLLDRNLNLVNEKDLELPYPLADVSYGDAIVDDDEAVYMLMSRATPQTKEMSKVQNPAREHFLLRYAWGDNTISEKALSIGVKWIYQVMLTVNAEGNLQVLGYYSNMIDLAMAGTFSVAFDRKNAQILESGLSPFERAFKAQFRPIGNLNDRPELGLFETDMAIAKSNNLVMLISEKRHIQQSTMFNPATGTYYVVQNFLFDDLLLTSMAPSSKIVLNIKIPKFQASLREEASFTSYLTWRGKQSTYLIFNDHERNANLEIHAASKYYTLNSSVNAQAVAYQVGDDGALAKHILFKYSPSKGVLNPRFSYALPQGVVLFTEGVNGLQLARVKFQFAESARESE